MEDCHGVGEESLKFLSILKQEKPGSGKIAAGANTLQTSIRALQRKANVREDVLGVSVPFSSSPLLNTFLLYLLVTHKLIMSMMEPLSSWVASPMERYT